MLRFVKRNWQALGLIVGSLALFPVLLWLVIIPVWSECLAKNSWLFCAVALGGK